MVDGVLRGEDVIFLSGMLADAQGTYASSQEYVQLPWSIHTPYVVGEESAMFIGIAHGGVIVTGMLGTRGADLVTRHRISAEQLGAVFGGVPPDQKLSPSRSVLAECFFRGLASLETDVPLPDLESQGVEGWIRMIGGLAPEERVEYVRRQLTTGFTRQSPTLMRHLKTAMLNTLDVARLPLHFQAVLEQAQALGLLSLAKDDGTDPVQHFEGWLRTRYVGATPFQREGNLFVTLCGMGIPERPKRKPWRFDANADPQDCHPRIVGVARVMKTVLTCQDSPRPVPPGFDGELSAENYHAAWLRFFKDIDRHMSAYVSPGMGYGDFAKAVFEALKANHLV